MSKSEHVIHRSVSDDGVLEVSQSNTIRSLYFGSDAKQSSMDMLDPNQLLLTYTQAMMASLLLMPAPKRVLIIGLGGGSLVKFIHYNYPDCQLDVVEMRADVVKVAHGYFCLPEHPLINIHIEDACHYIRRDISHYDLILIDAYDHAGMPDSLKSYDFLNACSERLNPQGICVVNLWEFAREGFNNTINTLYDVFGGNLLQLPIQDRGNVIVMAANMPQIMANLNSRLQLANELEQRTQLPYPNMLKQLKKANRWHWLHQLFR